MRAALATVVAWLALAAPALADQTIYAGPPNMFYTGSVSIDQGEKVTFTNLDSVEHDVTAATKGADGKPLFNSPLEGPGGSGGVAGTEFLTTGSYDFSCSIHPFMHGTIQVTAAGTPKPRPGSGGGSGSQPAPAGPAGDTRKPSLKLKVLDASLAKVRKRRALALRVTSDEAVTVGLTARSGKTRLAATTVRLTKAGSRSVALKLTSAGARAVKRAKSLRVAVSARAADAASNTSTAAASRTLRR